MWQNTDYWFASSDITISILRIPMFERNESDIDQNNIALTSNSVTALLKAESGHEVIAEVIKESWGQPSDQEIKMLAHYDLKPQRSWIREVLLKTNGETRALARILVVEPELAQVPWVQKLGDKPLGGTLFSQYTPVREHAERECASFNETLKSFSEEGQSRALQNGFSLEGQYWLRSSVLNIENKVHCLVTECFLS